jgi:hypothetical protein
MLGIKAPSSKRPQEEAENPFWISYSDLMTALMVLFLVAVSVALFSITQKVISGPDKHGKMVEVCMAEVSEMTQKEFPGIEVQGHAISFGTLALFGTNKHRLDVTAEKTFGVMCREFWSWHGQTNVVPCSNASLSKALPVSLERISTI